MDLDVPFGRAPVEDAEGAAAEAAVAAVGGFLTEILRGQRWFSVEYLVVNCDVSTGLHNNIDFR